MNDDFASLFAYTKWANDLMLEYCRKLTQEQYTAEPVPGWSSIQSTVAHIAVATEGWMRGVAGLPTDSFPSQDAFQTVDSAAAHLQKAYGDFERALPGFTAEWLATPRTFKGRTRTVVVPPWVVLRHVANHGTYHRGQVASKLKRFGIDPPLTDLIYWAAPEFFQNL